MKILVASDIHGSFKYTKKLVDLFSSGNFEMLILLGDIYNHGPRNALPEDYSPMQVASLLNGIKDNLLVIKGNCDSEVDAMISEFDFVDFGQMYIGGKRFSFTHGQKYNKDNLPSNVGDVLMYGHFHTGFIEKFGKTIVANPGSISLPKDNCHSYIVIENNQLQLWDIQKNIIIKNGVI